MPKKGRNRQKPFPPIQPATSTPSPELSLRVLDDAELKRLGSNPNVQVYNSVPMGTYDVITPEELTAAYEEFRPLFVRLRDENPSWSEEETREYMYENDSSFRCFYDTATVCAEILTSDKFDKHSWEGLLKLQDKVCKKEMSVGQMVGQLLGSHRFEQQAQMNFQKFLKDEYDGSVAAFMSAEAKELPLSKAYTDKYMKQTGRGKGEE